MKWETLPENQLAEKFNAMNGVVQMMREVMHCFTQPCIIKDVRGRMLYLNEAAEEWMDCSLNEARGKTSELFLTADDYRKSERYRRGVVAGQGALAFTERARARAIYTVGIVFPFCDDDGDMLLGVIRRELSSATEPKRK